MVKIQPMKAPPPTNAIKKDKKSDLILRTKNKQSDLYLFLPSCQKTEFRFLIFFLSFDFEFKHRVLLQILHW